MTRLLPIFFPKFKDTHWSFVVNLPRSPGILVIIFPCEVLVSALVSLILSAILYYRLLSKTDNVASGDFIDLPYHG